MSETVYIGIGSNMGSPRENCRQAMARLNVRPGITAMGQSSLYETEPVGVEEQNWFVNAVMEIKTDFNPEELLTALLKIEQEMGRVRREKWGPRIIDLDILFYGNRIIDTARLKIPHPEAARRRFVLAPLEEINPNLRHPALDKTVRELLAALPNEEQTARRLS
ncbi:MAG: 2-amino-4-hydroxy-6-hydroxymethyldihydropteridine diphosphokinase [Nitrospinales bacterium]